MGAPPPRQKFVPAALNYIIGTKELKKEEDIHDYKMIDLTGLESEDMELKNKAASMICVCRMFCLALFLRSPSCCPRPA